MSNLSHRIEKTVATAFYAFAIAHVVFFGSTLAFALNVLGRGPPAAKSIPMLALVWTGVGGIIAILAGWRWRELTSRYARQLARAGGMWSILALLAGVILVAGGYANFPAWSGGDGASHLGMAKMFLAGRIEENAGQVGLSGFVVALQCVFGINLWEGFRVSYFFTLSNAAIFVALLASFASESFRRTDIWIRIGFWVFISLPIFAYLQADGFFWHFYGMNAWLIGALFFLRGRTPFEQALGWGVGCVLIRFTYGLNLPDALLIFGFLALRLRGWMRVAGIAAGVSSALYGYRLLLDLVHLGGGLREMDYFNNFGALIAMCLFFRLSLADDGTVAPRSRDSFWLAARVSGVAALLIGAGWVGSIPKNYYFLKYSMTPVLLGSLLLAALGPEAARRSSGLPLKVRRLSYASGALAVACLLLSTDAYREPFLRNTPLRSAETLRLSPLLDPEVRNLVERVRSEGREFRLFITRSWPEYTFTNTFYTDFLAGGTLGFWGQTNYENFLRWTTLASADRRGCIFWRGDISDELPAFGPVTNPSRMALRKRLSDMTRTCVPTRKIEETREAFLCYACD